MDLSYDTVIIGSGFAGRTVASHLGDGSYVILERGENRDYGDVLRRYDAALADGGSAMEAQKAAYRSDRPWNRFERLSRWNYSQLAMIRGGASNWWGGKATRFSKALFSAKGLLPWAFDYAEVRPWYEKAEVRLNICGDPTHPEAPAPVTMPGATYWRSAFAPYFTDARLYNVALNKRADAPGTQGHCSGRANCAVCRDDAKARPDNIFPEHHLLCDTLVTGLLFEGERAVGVACYDGRQVFEVACRRVVVAANGIETPRLLARSDLPSGVRRASLGRHLQDHAHLELHCKIGKPLAYGNVGGLCHVPVHEISHFYPTAIGPIEVSALALTHEPDPQAFLAGMDLSMLRTHGAAAFLRDLRGCFQIFCELEIPPQADFRVDLESELPRVLDDGYASLIPVFDGVTDSIVHKLKACGVDVLSIKPLYRDGYGGHHFCGTVNCSASDAAAVDRDMRLIGTENVFIAGTSVIPRAGGVAPTLTLVALAERLGAALAADAP